MASARYLFGSGAGDFAIAPPSRHGGFLVAATSVSNGTFWSARTGGTQYTDLQTVNGGAAGTISTDKDGSVIPFYGPLGVFGGWIDFGLGGRVYVAGAESIDAAVAAAQEVSQSIATSATASASAAATAQRAAEAAATLAQQSGGLSVDTDGTPLVAGSTAPTQAGRRLVTEASGDTRYGHAESVPSSPIPPVGPRLPILNTEPGHAWVAELASASNLADTSTFPVGSQSISITTTGTAGGGTRLSRLGAPAVDLTGYNLGVWLRIDGLANLDQVNIYAGHNALANTYTWTPARGTDLTPYAMDGEWVLHTFNIGDANTAGAPVRTGITDWRVRVLDKQAGGTVTVHVGPIVRIPITADYPNGVVSITFDDGYDNNYTLAKPILDTYGFPATMYVIRDQLGTAGKITVAQAQEMKNRSGWEFAVHADTLTAHDATYPTLSTKDLQSAVRDAKSWLVDNGFGRGGEHLAYPQGKYTNAVMDTVRRYVSTGRSVVGYPRETLPPADPMRLRGVTGVSSVGTTVAAVKAMIDKAYLERQWLILILHRIVPGTATASTECSTADLDAIASYIASKGMPVRNVSSVAATLTSNKPQLIAASAPTGPTTSYVRKAADTTINNSAALAGDPELSIPVVAGGVYELQSFLLYSSSTTADMLMGWTGPTGSTFDWTPDALTVAATGSTGQVNRARSSLLGTAPAGGAATGAGGKIVARPTGVLVAAANGNLTLTWAQNTAEATDTTLYAGSFLKLVRIA